MSIERRDFIAALAAAFLAKSARAAAISVDETGIVRAGGLDQWVEIHGQDRRNPVILVVHGGPGEAQWPAAGHYRPWQSRFTLALWDQRGAGRTFGRYGVKTPDVNLHRIALDGIEVAEHLCRRLAKRKIIVLGNSCGSIVAVRMVQARPDLFAAYVGTGQAVSWASQVQGQFDVLLAKARADHDLAATKALEQIGKPDPNDAAQYFGFNRTLSTAMDAADQAWLAGLRGASPQSLGVSEQDFQALVDGMDFSARSVLPDQMATDLLATATDIKTAFFVIQGRDDVTTPTTAAVNYFDKVLAPKKELVLIEHAGHFAFMTHPQAFLAALVDTVRPIALARGA